MPGQSMDEEREAVAVLGGAGNLGLGLARRWSRAGHRVIVGSRDPLRAKARLDAEAAASPGPRIEAATYEAAAAAADLVVLTVPFAAQAEVLEAVLPHLAGKVLIDCTAPLRPPRVGAVQLPAEGSAAQRAQALVGPQTRVVSAFQNIAAALLRAEADHIDCDVLVCADDDEARAIGVRMAERAGLRAYQAGPLANAAAAEAMTSVLIQINRRYKSRHAGLRITGLPPSDEAAHES